MGKIQESERKKPVSEIAVTRAFDELREFLARLLL
jgi:hypothetical protein